LRKRTLKSKRVTNGKNFLPDPQILGSAKGNRFEFFTGWWFELDHRQVILLVCTYNLGFVPGTVGQVHKKLIRVFYDVIVRHDMSFFVDDRTTARTTTLGHWLHEPVYGHDLSSYVDDRLVVFFVHVDRL
jgi:hypothetical protein